MFLSTVVGKMDVVVCVKREGMCEGREGMCARKGKACDPHHARGLLLSHPHLTTRATFVPSSLDHLTITHYNAKVAPK